MTPLETSRVLAKAAIYDKRIVGEGDVLAWWEACGDLEYVDALQAVILHYRDGSDWLMPANLRFWAAQAKRERLRGQRSEALALPSRFEPVADATAGAFERASRARQYARAKAREASEKFHAAHDAHDRAMKALDRLDEAISELVPEHPEAPHDR